MSARALNAPKRRIAFVLGTLVAAMVGLSFASVPLYRLFCEMTGYDGTTGIAETAPGAVGTRLMTVQFNADVGQGMAWHFKPVAHKTTVKIGEQTLAFYTASNPTDRPITGTATFNVTPDKAGIYFNKIECFCFTEQTLAPGETVEFPVSFFVDPAILEDRGLDKVETITLSYTFFEREEVAAKPVRDMVIASRSGARTGAQAN